MNQFAINLPGTLHSVWGAVIYNQPVNIYKQPIKKEKENDKVEPVKEVIEVEDDKKNL
jgi:hypothetical protein